MREVWVPSEYILLWGRETSADFPLRRWASPWGVAVALAVPDPSFVWSFVRSFVWLVRGHAAGGEGICGKQAVETFQAEVVRVMGVWVLPGGCL